MPNCTEEIESSKIEFGGPHGFFAVIFVPDRHVPATMALDRFLAVDNGIDAFNREDPSISLLQGRQIAGRHLQQLGVRPITLANRAMEHDALGLEFLLSGIELPGALRLSHTHYTKGSHRQHNDTLHQITHDGKCDVFAPGGIIGCRAAFKIVCSIHQLGDAVLRIDGDLRHFQVRFLQLSFDVIHNGLGQVHRKPHGFMRADQVAERHCGLVIRHGDLIAFGDLLQSLRAYTGTYCDQPSAQKRGRHER